MLRCIPLGSFVGLIALSAAAQLPRTEAITIALPLAQYSKDDGGCYASSELTDPGAAAYADHLDSRFANRIVLCLTETSAEAAALAANGDATLAWIDQSDALSLPETWRSFLTLRAFDGLGRPPYVFFAAADAIDARQIGEEQIGVVSREPERLFVEMAFETLQDLGLTQNAVTANQKYRDVSSLFEAIRAGDMSAGILDANAWGRNCDILNPASNPCSDLKVLYEGRPRADQAMVIEADQSTEFRYRMVSVHIALHLETPEAFQWINQDRGTEFQPAEHDALLARPTIWSGSE